VATAQILLSGTLTITPTSVVGVMSSSSSAGGLPAGTDQIPLVTNPNPKPSAVRCNGNKRNSSALGTYVSLSGIGPTDNVTTADFLYVNTDAPMTLQLTLQNLVAGSGTITSVVSVYGPQVFQFPPGGYLTAVGASGNGNVEYLGSGPA
jgi:hypothetical protein